MKNIRGVIGNKMASELTGKCTLAGAVILVINTGKLADCIYNACNFSLYGKVSPSIPKIIYRNYNFNGM